MTVTSIISVTDDVAPVTGTLISGASTNDPNLTVQLSLSGTGALAGYTVQLYNGTDTSGPLGSSYTLTSTDIANGYANVQTGTLTDGTTYMLTARITDAVGNQSAVSSNSFTVTEDTTAPLAPAIASVIDDVAPVTGPLTTTALIELSGSTYLTEVTNHFYLFDSGGSGPSLKYGGVDVVAGQFSGWIPIGAEQTASGYEVAWKLVGGDQYAVWSTDSSGNHISDTGVLSGSDPALQSLETSFHQDLNGDGVIGPSTVIEANGSTTLTEVANHYYLSDSGGSGPSLKSGGVDIVAGQYGGWIPISAEQTASGYEVAWRLAGADQYAVWSTDSSGNLISETGIMSGSNLALQSLETSFHQDLNGDGHIGLNGIHTNDPDLTVKVTVSGTGALAGDTVQLYNGTDTSSSLGSSYTLTSADIANGYANVQTGTLTDGTTYMLTARITDAAGNQSAVSSNSFTVTEDSTAPAAATITSVTDDVAPVTGTLVSGASTNDPNLTVQLSLSGTGALAGDTVQLYNGTDTSSSLGSSYTLTSADIANGYANVQTGTLTDGTTYMLTARITDAAGNQSAVSSNSFTVTEDSTAPAAATITSVTDDVAPVTGTLVSGASTNDPNLTVQLSLSGTGALAGDTVQLYNGTDTSSSLGSSYTLTSADIANGYANVQTGTLTDGTTYMLTARITDAAGNQSAVSSNSFTVTEDSTAPAAATITSVTDDVAPVTGTLVSGASTNDPNLTVQLSLSGTGALAGDTVQLYNGTDTSSSLGSSYTLTSADIANGYANVQTGTLTDGTTYMLTARITDAAGNQSAVSSNSFTVTEDSTAPAAATITSVTDDVAPVTGTLVSGASTNDPNLTVQLSLSGTGALAGDTVQLYNGTDTSSSLGSSYTLTSADIANGYANVQTGTLTDGTTYMLTARITDAAGNQSAVSSNSFTVTEDSTAPAAATITSVTDDVAPVTGTLVSGASTNDPNLTVQLSLSGTGALAGDTVQLYNGTDTSSSLGSSYTLTSADIANGYANVQTGTLTDGTTYMLTARITDAAGNQSAVSSNSFTVTEDSTAPAVTESLNNDTGSSSSDKITSNATLTGSGDANATVHFTVDGNAIAATTTADDGGSWTYTPSGLADGTHTIMASETDPAGNTGTASLIFTLDTIVNAPGVALANDTGTSNSDKITQDPTLALTGVETGAVVQYSLDGTHWSATAPTVASLAQGSDTVFARQIDIAGNVSSATSLTFTLYTPTVIEANGSTSLAEVANNYFLDDSGGSGPSLKYGGADVVAGQFGAWTPIGAEQTASGYEVAWKIRAPISIRSGTPTAAATTSRI